MGVDRIEDGFGQLVFFQQVTKFQQSRRIRCRFPIQINTNKAANGLTIVELTKKV